MENGNTDIKVQLAGLKKDIENVSNLNSRLDTAIEKLTDVSTSIKSMLAVHEEKIQRQEQIDDIMAGAKPRVSQVSTGGSNSSGDSSSAGESPIGGPAEET